MTLKLGSASLSAISLKKDVAMAGDEAKQNPRNAVPPPKNGKMLLGAISLILTGYAIYSVRQGEFMLPYKLSPHSPYRHLLFNGAILWVLAVGVWIIALGLAIAIFEFPAASNGPLPEEKGKRLPSFMAGFLFLFLGTAVYKLRGRQTLSVWVSFFGITIAGAAFIVRLSGLL